MDLASMRMPESLAGLVDYGIIQEVVRPLMSGKEAQIYLVISGGEERVAKVYKEAQERTFKHRAEYTEGRKTRNSRDQRAINKRTRHGREQDEAAWRSAEVDMIHRLRGAGVAVPEPFHFVDGVLVMELIKDAAGNPAPRLGDLHFEPGEAIAVYEKLIAEVVRMLCAGAVHGDLSEFNVLMGADGPVMIDFPQSVDPASNQNARRLLLRDVANLQRFLARLAPSARRAQYAEEMWQLYQANLLTPATKLAGGYKAPQQKTDTGEVLSLIAEAREDERARRGERGDEPEPPVSKPLRRVVDLTQTRSTSGSSRRSRGDERGGRARASRSGRGKKPVTTRASSQRSGPKTAASSGGDPASAARKQPSKRPRGRADPLEASAGSEAAGAPPQAAKRRRRRGRNIGGRGGRGQNAVSEATTGGSQTSVRPRASGASDRAKGAATRDDAPREPSSKPARPSTRRRTRRRRRPARSREPGPRTPNEDEGL